MHHVMIIAIYRALHAWSHGTLSYPTNAKKKKPLALQICDVNAIYGSAENLSLLPRHDKLRFKKKMVARKGRHGHKSFNRTHNGAWLVS